MKTNDLYFEQVKEHRNQYFVEYKPPIPSYRFAILNLVFLNPADKKNIAELMETELDYWLKRYPIPIMVSAFDEKGDSIHLSSVKDCDHLIGFIEKGAVEPRRIWRLVKDDELPIPALDKNYLRRVYADIPFKTGEQIQQNNKKRYRSIKTGWVVFFIWLVIVPATIAILGWANRLIGAIALSYSIYKAVVTALKLTGKVKPSPKEIERAEKEQKMEHYYYHCELNPEGFRKIMIENFKNEAEEDIRKEAEMLKLKQKIDGQNNKL